MTQISRTALLPYSAEKMFELVNDVSAYPDYMDGCQKVEIIESSNNTLSARLHLKKGGLSQSFATTNTLERPHKISLELLEGPFEFMKGEWNFKPLASNACKVSLDLTFKINNSLTHKAAEKLFESVAANLVSSLCQRADAVIRHQSSTTEL